LTRLTNIAENIHTKHFEKHRQNKNSVKKIDRAMATIGVLGPMATFVQIFHIFSTRAVAGISPITWFGYTAVSLCWIFYGFFYKDKPIVIVNTLGSMASATVFVGYMLFR
jgi:uncharacterized protein with PQ loop repeat